MNQERVLYKIWRILYPLLIYFLLDVLVIWAVQYLMVFYVAMDPGSFLARNTPAIGTILFLLISIPICRKIYQMDYNRRSGWIYRRSDP